MLIPSMFSAEEPSDTSLSRRVNANSQRAPGSSAHIYKLIKKGEC